MDDGRQVVRDMHPATSMPQLPIETDEHGRPKVERLRGRIGDLEHRLDFLERKYDPTRDGEGRSRMVGEAFALQAAIAIMSWHDLELDREHAVVVALGRILQALESYDLDDDDALAQAVAGARTALAEARG